MVLSVSRRTDIPSFYSEWFLNRVKAGEVCVRNPMNPQRVSKIKIHPDAVDFIVFWTKNPAPMLDRIGELKDYCFYFQFSLNSYAKDIETKLDRKATIIETFKRLSDKIGPERVLWRYDPILINPTYSVDYHIANFEKIAARLKGYTYTCTISFVDFYRNAAKNFKEHNIKQPNLDEKKLLAKHLSITARANGITVGTCAEGIGFEEFDIKHAKCIDDSLMERILGCRLNAVKDTNQRKECGCIQAIDIGAYNSCRNGCAYCYANYSPNAVKIHSLKHNPLSPLLIGDVQADDIITVREMKSLRGPFPQPNRAQLD